MIPKNSYTWPQVMAQDLNELLEKAQKLSWEIHGKQVRCFIPGQMFFQGQRGKYPTISLTGSSCALQCDHCYRKILDGMIPASDPLVLQQICQRLDEEGNLGVLLSGGSDEQGALPWQRFRESIRWIKQHTRLKITVHTGLIDATTASALESAGIDEALIDVIGSAETMERVYHLSKGLDAMESSLSALAATRVPLIPHIVLGLHYGQVKGEMHALEMVAKHPVAALVIVVLNPIKGTPMEGVLPASPEVVARFVAAARLRLPHVPLSLSCARPAGAHRAATDLLCLEAGINRIAMPSDKMLQKAKKMGLHIDFYHTCCSKSY